MFNLWKVFSGFAILASSSLQNFYNQPFKPTLESEGTLQTWPMIYSPPCEPPLTGNLIRGRELNRFTMGFKNPFHSTFMVGGYRSQLNPFSTELTTEYAWRSCHDQPATVKRTQAMYKQNTLLLIVNRWQYYANKSSKIMVLQDYSFI